jgi:hypothetical protein
MKVEFCLATGGMNIKGQEALLRKGPDIVVATPGRLIDHLHNAPSFDLQSIEILVLDEADRMLEEHFEDQLNEIIRLCPRGRQSMLFSATMTDEVKELVRLSLNQPVRLFVDSNMDVAANLQQEFIRIRPNREDDRQAVILGGLLVFCCLFKGFVCISLSSTTCNAQLHIFMFLLTFALFLSILSIYHVFIIPFTQNLTLYIFTLFDC